MPINPFLQLPKKYICDCTTVVLFLIVLQSRTFLYHPYITISMPCSYHRKIRLIENNAKCRYLKTLTCKGTLRQVFYLSEALSPPLTPYNPPSYTLYITVYVYTVYFSWPHKHRSRDAVSLINGGGRLFRYYPGGASGGRHGPSWEGGVAWGLRFHRSVYILYFAFL